MRLSSTRLVLLLAAAAVLACAQDYSTFTVNCLKVNPAKVAEFEKLQKDVIRPLRQLEADRGDIIGWSLHRAILPAGDDAPCTHLSVVAHSSLKSVNVPGRQEQSWAAAKLPLTYAQYTSAFQSLASRRYNELWRVVGSGGSREVGQFVRWTFSKRNDLPAFIKAHQEHMAPVKALQLKEGKLKSWTQLTLSMNSNSSPYNTVMLSAVTDFIDTQVQPFTDNAVLMKKHFNKDYDALFEKAVPIRSEIYRIIETVRSTRPATASGGAK